MHFAQMYGQIGQGPPRASGDGRGEVTVVQHPLERAAFDPEPRHEVGWVHGGRRHVPILP
jgi:hypothetical protein